MSSLDFERLGRKSSSEPGSAISAGTICAIDERRLLTLTMRLPREGSPAAAVERPIANTLIELVEREGLEPSTPAL
jgi:hypothetical protein